VIDAPASPTSGALRLTLGFAMGEAGEAAVWLAPGDALGRAPHWWHGRHRFDAARAEEELAALGRAVRRAVGRGGDADALAAHGRLLFDLLLPAPVKERLRAAPGGLLAVAVERGAGPDVPWPLLHDGRAFLGLRWALGELAAAADAAPPVPVVERERLLLVADPSGDLAAARFEGEALLRELAEGGLACDLRLGALRASDFLRIFRDFRFVHFAGHADPPDGARPAGWRFADGRLSAAELGALRGGAAPGLVFANACGSAGPAGSLADALLAGGVRHFVGTLVDLPDLPGADFARRFYSALGEGRPVGESLRLARLAALRDGDGVWAAYRLLGDPETAWFRARAQERFSVGVRTGVVLAARRPVAAEPTSPEAFAEAREGWRAQLRATVEAEGGRLLPGRGAVDRAVFGVPFSYENDALRAARAAWRLRDALGEGVAVLASGPLVAAGPDVVGHAVVEAEAAAWRLGPGLWALPDVARRLTGFALGAARDDAAPVLGPGGAVAVEDTPLVGRAAELARLEAAAEAVLRTGTPAAATLLGPAGMGKSRLAAALVERLADRFAVLRGAGVPYDEASPFAAVAGVLRDLIGVEEGAPDARVRERLEALLERLDANAGDDGASVLSIDALVAGGAERPRLSARLEVLAAALGLGAEAHRAPAEAGLVPAAVRELVAAAARERPLLIVFEDLHWQPPAGLAVVDELLAGLRGAPVLLVSTARPELLERAPNWFESPRHHRVDLGPLAAREAEALLRHVAPAAEGPALQALLERAEGNPLFLRELGLAGGGSPADALPASIEAVMLARLDRQSPLEREVLRAAAIIGRTFWQEGVERLLRRAGVAEALERLSARRFVVRRPTSELAGLSEWRFTHALLQETVHRSMGERARSAYHGRAALWLAEEVAAQRPDLWSRIAAHFAAAGDAARATTAWLRAAAHALEGYAPVEARRALEAALAQDDVAGVLAPAERARAEEQTADLARAAGDPTEAARRLDAAISHTPDGERAGRAERLRKRAEVDETLGDLVRARSRLAEALALLGEAAEGEARAVRIRCRRDEGWLCHRDGDYEGAVARLGALLAEVRDDEPELLGAVHNALGVAAYGRGDFPTAEHHYRRALAAYEAAGDEGRIATLNNNLGILAEKQGDFATAVACQQRALRIKAARGDRAGLARGYNNLGTLYGEMGEYERARDYLRESVRIRARAGDSGLAIGYANLGEAHLSLGELDEARDWLEKAIELCRAGRGPAYLLPDAWRMLAEVRLDQGDAPGAAEAATLALSLAGDHGDRPRAGAALRVLGEALSRQDRVAEADARLAEAVALLESLDQPLELGKTYAACARHARDPDAAARWRARARSVFTAVGATRQIARL
jgi:tetratricopeptide (TPR) repeat protein